MPDEPAARAWVFGDDVSTDVLSPGAYAVAPVEVRAMHCLESLDPRFPTQVRGGDIVIGGANFGCGSSRETAPENLKHLGVACVVAESFSRIFLRNSIAIGLAVLVCPDVGAAFEGGEPVKVDLAKGTVTNLSTGVELHGTPLPEDMRRIVEAGGILAVLEGNPTP